MVLAIIFPLVAESISTNIFLVSLALGLGELINNWTFCLDVIPIEQNDFLFGYQIFSGLEFRPLDSTSLGLRIAGYILTRWIYFRVGIYT